MLQFANELPLYFLWLPILLGIGAIFLRSRARIRLERRIPGIVRLTPGWLEHKANWEWIILSTALFFLLIGWADPRLGTKVETIERRGADIVIVLDISKSMDAVDVAPSRLDLAKRKVNRLLDRLLSDRVSLVFVSSRPFLQIPLTIDASIIRTWLEAVDTEVLPGGGTDIGGAMLMAAQQFEGDPARDRGVVLITDCEDHEGNIEEGVRALQKAGARLYVLGVGTPQGGPIPLKNRPGQFKTDNEGNMVITRLEEGELKPIALQTGGQYLRWRGDDGDITAILSGIGQLDKRKVGEKVVTEFTSRGLWFVAVGLILLLLERLLPLARRYRKEQWKRLLNRNPVTGWYEGMPK